MHYFWWSLRKILAYKRLKRKYQKKRIMYEYIYYKRYLELKDEYEIEELLENKDLFKEYFITFLNYVIRWHIDLYKLLLIFFYEVIPFLLNLKKKKKLYFYIFNIFITIKKNYSFINLIVFIAQVWGFLGIIYASYIIFSKVLFFFLSLITISFFYIKDNLIYQLTEASYYWMFEIHDILNQTVLALAHMFIKDICIDILFSKLYIDYIIGNLFLDKFIKNFMINFIIFDLFNLILKMYIELFTGVFLWFSNIIFEFVYIFVITPVGFVYSTIAYLIFILIKILVFIFYTFVFVYEVIKKFFSIFGADDKEVFMNITNEELQYLIKPFIELKNEINNLPNRFMPFYKNYIAEDMPYPVDPNSIAGKLDDGLQWFEDCMDSCLSSLFQTGKQPTGEEIRRDLKENWFYHITHPSIKEEYYVDPDSLAGKLDAKIQKIMKAIEHWVETECPFLARKEQYVIDPNTLAGKLDAKVEYFKNNYIELYKKYIVEDLPYPVDPNSIAGKIDSILQWFEDWFDHVTTPVLKEKYVLDPDSLAGKLDVKIDKFLINFEAWVDEIIKVKIYRFFYPLFHDHLTLTASTKYLNLFCSYEPYPEYYRFKWWETFDFFSIEPNTLEEAYINCFFDALKIFGNPLKYDSIDNRYKYSLLFYSDCYFERIEAWAGTYADRFRIFFQAFYSDADNEYLRNIEKENCVKYMHFAYLGLNEKERYDNIQESWVYFFDILFFKEIIAVIIQEVVRIFYFFCSIYEDLKTDFSVISKIGLLKAFTSSAELLMTPQEFTEYDNKRFYYMYNKYPPFLFFFDLKEAIDEEEDTYNRILCDWAAGDGGIYEAYQFKKNITHYALVEYVTILKSIEFDEEKKKYMSRFLADLKVTAKLYFPGLELKVSPNGLNSIEEVERYLGFDSPIETFRDDDRRFKKFDCWYYSSIYKYSIYRLLQRTGQIMTNLNMHRDFIVDGVVALKLDHDPYYSNLRSYLQPNYYHMVDYLLTTISLLKEGYNLFYFNCYEGDSFDYLVKPYIDNAIHYSHGEFADISFERYFQPNVYKVPYSHEKDASALIKQILPTNKDVIEVKPPIPEDNHIHFKDFEDFWDNARILTVDDRYLGFDLGLAEKAYNSYEEFLKKFYRIFVRVMKERPLRANLKGIEAQFYDIRLNHMYKHYFYDPIIDFRLFYEEIGFYDPFFVFANHSTVDPIGSDWFKTYYLDEVIATSSAYLEPFEDIYSVWTGSKYELFCLYVNHGISIDSFSNTFIYKLVYPLNPELAYKLGYYYYKFLIFCYTTLMPEYFLIMFFELLYKLNVSDIYYGFSGYFIYVLLGLSGMFGCILISSKPILRSSFLLQLVLFECALVSSVLMMLLMVIRIQYFDDIMDETVEWPGFRFFTYYTIEEHKLFSLCGRNMWLMVFVLFCLYAFECAFGLIMIIIAFNKLKSFSKMHLKNSKRKYYINYGFGLILRKREFGRYHTTLFERKHMFIDGIAPYYISNHDIDNDKISERVLEYVKHKQEKDLKQFEIKYESDIDWREPWKKREIKKNV